jgi:hypothetical protein
VTITILDCAQGSADWFRARAGVPTASQFHCIMTSGRGGGESKTRRSYLLKLAGERLTGEPLETYSNGDMERGQIMEDEARDLYAFMYDAEPQRVGFILNGDAGGSPDALIGDRGVLEIKSARAHILLDCLLKDEAPPEHTAQCQGLLWLAEREWIDLAVYWPKLPLFVKRIRRDETYIKKLSEAVAAFNAELHEVVERVRGRSPLKGQLQASLAALDAGEAA